MIWLILTCTSLLIFIVYNVVMISLFGIPYSLSGTYYLLNNKWEGSGIWFTISLISMFLILLPPWMYISTQINNLGNYLSILPFISSSAVIFVGIAPNIKSSERIEKIHTISAFIGAIAALLWICIVCWKIMYIIPILVGLCGLLAHLTKTAKSGRDYWIEMSIFGSTYSAILIEYFLVI